MRTTLTTLAALAVPAVLAFGAAPATAGNANPGGNNGTVKIAEIDDVGTPSNDPHVSCSFAVEWYGFDQGSSIYSDVTFESQAPTADATIAVTGTTHVFVGGDPAGGGTDLDGRVVYTLAFTGTPQAQQGFHVKMTTDTAGSHGADKKSKVFWVSPCSTTPTTNPGSGTTPTDPGTGTTPTDPGTGTTPTDPGTGTNPTDPGTGTNPGTDPTTQPTTEPVVSDPSSPAPAVSPWSWDWTYAAPSCTALTVDYPANLPEGQANDVNVRLDTNVGPVSLNFHNNTGTWSGHTVFTFAAHPQWPAGVTSATPVWVQVGGTNYHWQGSCAGSTVDPSTPEPLVTGFAATTQQVARGAAPRAVWVSVDEDAASSDVTLERLAAGSWRTATTATIDGDGQARVAFPRLTKRGSYQFRVSVDGVPTKPMTVKVR